MYLRLAFLALSDARHDYEGCTEDMTNYWSLINSGGILAGHDFEDANEVYGGTQWYIHISMILLLKGDVKMFV